MMHGPFRVALTFLLPVALLATLGAASGPAPQGEPLTLTASLSGKTLTVMRGSELVKSYVVAVGEDRHPTPAGTYNVRKIVWNPSWVPPDAKWAKGKKARAPGDPKNPMKLVKLFFREPDYFIHGTDAIETLGTAASHGCLRMHPDDAGELGLMVMENAGISRDWEWVKGLLHIGAQRTVALQRPASLTIVQ